MFTETYFNNNFNLHKNATPDITEHYQTTQLYSFTNACNLCIYAKTTNEYISAQYSGIE